MKNFSLYHFRMYQNNKTEKPFSLQDDEKEGSIMTELVNFFSPNKQKPKELPKQQPEQPLKELPKQLPKQTAMQPPKQQPTIALATI